MVSLNEERQALDQELADARAAIEAAERGKARLVSAQAYGATVPLNFVVTDEIRGLNVRLELAYATLRDIQVRREAVDERIASVRRELASVMRAAHREILRESLTVVAEMAERLDESVRLMRSVIAESESAFEGHGAAVSATVLEGPPGRVVDRIKGELARW
jgi:hypothetical protein